MTGKDSSEKASEIVEKKTALTGISTEEQGQISKISSLVSAVEEARESVKQLAQK